MKPLVSLLACSFMLSCASCRETPGMEEPLIVECTILGDTADCRFADGQVSEVPISDLVGYIATNPSGYVAVKNHHDALHLELNQCREKGR